MVIVSHDVDIGWIWDGRGVGDELGDVELNGLVLWRIVLDVFGRRAESLVVVGANVEGRVARRERLRRVVCVTMVYDLDSLDYVV